MKRETPTLSATGFMLIMQVIVSFHLVLFGADAKSAFLQGMEFTKGVLMKQPREGWPGIRPGRLMMVLKGGFGFLDSPRRWWRFFSSVLLKLGFHQMSLDVTIFVYYVQRRLAIAIGIHVDHVIGGYDETIGMEMLERLRSAVKWGVWRLKKLTLAGKDVTQDDNFEIAIGQYDYCASIVIPTIDRARASKPEALLEGRD